MVAARRRQVFARRLDGAPECVLELEAERWQKLAAVSSRKGASGTRSTFAARRGDAVIVGAMSYPP